jgi:hypothetical protein
MSTKPTMRFIDGIGGDSHDFRLLRRFGQLEGCRPQASGWLSDTKLYNLQMEPTRPRVRARCGRHARLICDVMPLQKTDTTSRIHVYVDQVAQFAMTYSERQWRLVRSKRDSEVPAAEQAS